MAPANKMAFDGLKKKLLLTETQSATINSEKDVIDSYPDDSLHPPSSLQLQ
jgi:hypothetical protein